MTPDCFNCKHFFVTWDRHAPRGCRAYGFKTEEIPSRTVHETTGIPCQACKPRPPTVERRTYEIIKN